MYDDINKFDFRGKKTLVRVDFNIPMNEKLEIVDDIRIQTSLPTIKKIINEGGSVILLSHLGRPTNSFDCKLSLQHLIPHLENIFGKNILFSHDCVGDETITKCANLKPGDILLLENVRFHKEEYREDIVFAKQLHNLADVYVNDAFAVSHRNHVSITTAARLFKHKMMGYLMNTEIENANKLLINPEKPFTAILGGSKISDKIELIDKLLEKVDNMLIGGGLANTFLKSLASNNHHNSTDNKNIKIAEYLLTKAQKTGMILLLPSDMYIADRFHNEANIKLSSSLYIEDGWLGLDIGPQTQYIYSKVIKKSKTILWNGPLGAYEMINFSEGTQSIIDSISLATRQGAFSLVGGGDTVAAIHSLNSSNEVSYISTGGGALLSYITMGTLPGIKAIQN